MKNLLTRAALACALMAAGLFAVLGPLPLDRASASTVVLSNGRPGYVTGSLTAASGAGSESDYVIPAKGVGFNVTLTNTGVGSVVLERSFDGGTTWSGLYAGGVQLYSWSYVGTAVSEVAFEPEFNVLYRLRCSSYTSGTITYRISQVLNS
jgi:hypothetical protein